MAFAWPEDRVATLVSLVNAGKSDQEIADRLGITPRAVLGKRQRMKLHRPARGDALRMALDRAARDSHTAEPGSPPVARKPRGATPQRREC